MHQKRREFLKVAATLTSGVALSTFAANLIGCSAAKKLSGAQRPFGLQLYTLRNEMAKDPKGTLKARLTNYQDYFSPLLLQLVSKIITAAFFL